MWNLKCSNCGDSIEKENKENVRTNIEDDPICDDCPYAEEPDYPVEGSIEVRREAIDNKTKIKSLLPHLEEKIEEEGLVAIDEELASMLTYITIEFKIDKTENKYGSDKYDIEVTGVK